MKGHRRELDAETIGRVAALLCRHAARASVVAGCLEDLGLEVHEVDPAVAAALERMKAAVARHAGDG